MTEEKREKLNSHSNSARIKAKPSPIEAELLSLHPVTALRHKTCRKINETSSESPAGFPKWSVIVRPGRCSNGSSDLKCLRKAKKGLESDCGTYVVEFASVVITVVDAHLTAKDASVAADREVVWHERAAVGLQHDLTLEEGALGRARVDLLGLSDHDRLVFQVVENGNFPDFGVFEAAFNDVLLEVTVESQDLL